MPERSCPQELKYLGGSVMMYATYFEMFQEKSVHVCVSV